MQDILGIPAAGRQLVNSYGEGRFRVSGQLFNGSVLILPDQTVSWPISDISKLTENDLDIVMRREPAIDILLIGCGPGMAFIPDDIRSNLRRRGTVIDAMNTGAAARTYNILLLEERRVAAALVAL